MSNKSSVSTSFRLTSRFVRKSKIKRSLGNPAAEALKQPKAASAIGRKILEQHSMHTGRIRVKQQKP